LVSSPYKAVLFDLDDTLLDRRSAYDHAYHCFYESQPAIRESTSWQEAREFFWSLSPNNATDARTAIAEIMCRWPGVKSDPDTHEREYFHYLIEGLKPLPGVQDFVSALNTAGLPWGIITNGGPYQLKKIEKVGWQKSVPVLLVSKLFGSEKPAPDIYHEAVRRLGLNGAPYHRVLFFGDNPFTDIAGAHAVGMKTAWVRMGREYPQGAPAPDYVIESVTELRQVLGL